MTGIRFFAAAAVIITHVSFQTLPNQSSFFGKITARFDYAVAIFFALSGFLLWRKFIVFPLLNQTPIDWKQYLRSRFKRIYPAYLVVTLLSLTLFVYPSFGNIKIWIANLTLTQNLQPFTIINSLTQMWSLAVEVQFYLCLPFLGKIVQYVAGINLKSRMFCLTSIFIFSFIWIWLINYLVPFSDQNFQLWLPAYFAWFIPGILLAEIYEYKKKYKFNFNFLQKIAKQKLICFIVSAIFFSLAASSIFIPTGLVTISNFEFNLKILFGALTATFLLIPYTLAPPKINKILDSKLLQNLGKCSYSIFLWHVLILNFSFTFLNINPFSGNSFTIFIFTFLFTIWLSTISYNLFEVSYVK